jgi:hypothetical protein
MKQTQSEKSNKSYTIELIEDGDDLILPLPERLLEEAGWKDGDLLDWTDNGNGSWTLKKIPEVTPEEEEAWKEIERKNNI